LGLKKGPPGEAITMITFREVKEREEKRAENNMDF